MKLDFSFLADSAQVGPDGRFSVLGGDRMVYESATFPYPIPSVALIFKLTFSEQEIGTKFPVRVHLANSHGEQLAPAADGVIEAPRPTLPELPSTGGMLVSFNVLVVPSPDRYEFRVSVGDETLPPTYMYVVKSRTTE